MIIISVDVTKLDKERFKAVVKRDGTTAKYAELVLIDTPNGEYGDFMVKQGVTKEEREARKEMPILGNGKIVGSNRGGPSAKHSAPNEPEPADEDEVPF